ncbi:MAG: glycosyltransferase family 4 protein [Rikenellaceae bacterium]
MSKIGYKQLLKHYNQMLELFDVVHFSSQVPENQYRKHTSIRASERVAITNNNIADNRKERGFDSQGLKLLFVGNTSSYKGFTVLEQVLQELHYEGCRDWSLDVWGDVGHSDCELITYRGSYKPEELGKIYQKDSLLIVPSLWHETFSLTTLEALSYGTPVLVSSVVGAKDIVGKYDDWFIFAERAELKYKLLRLIENRTQLREFNKAIVNGAWEHSLRSHAQEIIKLYK